MEAHSTTWAICGCLRMYTVCVSVYVWFWMTNPPTVCKSRKPNSIHSQRVHLNVSIQHSKHFFKLVYACTRNTRLCILCMSHLFSWGCSSLVNFLRSSYGNAVSPLFHIKNLTELLPSTSLCNPHSGQIRSRTVASKHSYNYWLQPNVFWYFYIAHLNTQKRYFNSNSNTKRTICWGAKFVWEI